MEIWLLFFRTAPDGYTPEKEYIYIHQLNYKMLGWGGQRQNNRWLKFWISKNIQKVPYYLKKSYIIHFCYQKSSYPQKWSRPRFLLSEVQFSLTQSHFFENIIKSVYLNPTNSLWFLCIPYITRKLLSVAWRGFLAMRHDLRYQSQGGKSPLFKKVSRVFQYEPKEPTIWLQIWYSCKKITSIFEKNTMNSCESVGNFEYIYNDGEAFLQFTLTYDR